MNRSESIVKISTALVKAQSKMGNAIKDAKNPFFKSSYADLNAVREACLPVLNENGISVLQPTIHENSKSYVETVLLHESGEYISSLTEILCAKPNDAQAQGSGISYARRYGLQSLVNLGSADDDAEGAMNRTPPAPKKDIVKEVAAKTTPAPAAAPAKAAASGQAPSQAVTGSAPAPAARTASFRRSTTPAAAPAKETAKPATAPAQSQDAEPEIEM